MALKKEELDRMRELVGRRLLERLADDSKPIPASLANAAATYLKLHGSYASALDREKLEDKEEDQRRAELLASLPFRDNLPFPVAEAADEDDSDDD